jgi:xanthine/uracil permease
MLGNLIGGFIVILVGATLAPTVADEVKAAQNNGNISGASDTIIGLTTLFYCCECRYRNCNSRSKTIRFNVMFPRKLKC